MEENRNDIKNTEWNDNRSYFLFPLKIEDYKAFELTLKTDWQTVKDPFDVKYLLNYAAKISQSGSPEQMLTYRCLKKPPVYMFETKISEKIQRYRETHPSFKPSGTLPRMAEIRLYVFQRSIAFLEFEVLYGDMKPEEVAEFVYLFRSLRNDEMQKRIEFPEDKISVKAAINMLLPPKESGTVLCFENPSDVKMQANIYTMLYDPSFFSDVTSEEFHRLCYILYKGYSCTRPADENDSGYQFYEKLGGTQWGGCQDGVACLIPEPYMYQNSHLRNDYHFMYLLLLNQRFMAIADIDKLSQPQMKEKEIQAVYDEISVLKTRYSFRVVSNDSYMQTLYNRMYCILEIDNLLKDSEDANDRMNDINQKRRQRKETIFNYFLFGLATLAIFSAFIDLSDYLDRWKDLFTEKTNTLIGLLATVLIVILTFVIWLIREHRRK